MEKVTDWIALWRQLAESPRWNRMKHARGGDPWRVRAREFDSGFRGRREGTDPLRALVESRVEGDTTVLDIGAGTGRWAIPLARRAREVTALDPSPAMLEVLREKIAAEGISNIEIVQGAWPVAEVAPHDFSLCSHSMYSCPDLPGFVNRMIQVTRRTCFLVLRVPARDGVMAEVARHLWGQPHDSPNFVVAYNVLMEMGIYPNVLVDPLLEPWRNASLQDALADLKRRFGLEDDRQDGFLAEVLSRRLEPRDGEYVWPDGMRSALVYWDVGERG